MTEQHPITPPPELVMQWVSLACEYEGNETWIDLATQAARWGADQKLEACCECVALAYGCHAPVELSDARRPKPPSLAEQALKELEQTMVLLMPVTGFNKVKRFATIRAALERLQELENND